MGQPRPPAEASARGSIPHFLVFPGHVVGLSGLATRRGAAGMNGHGGVLAFVEDFHHSFSGADAHPSLRSDTKKWTARLGMGGRHGPEWVDGFLRNYWSPSAGRCTLDCTIWDNETQCAYTVQKLAILTIYISWGWIEVWM